MHQKRIVLYLHMKEIGLTVIHEDLVHTLGKEGVAYSTLGKHVRNARFARKTEAFPRKLQRADTVLLMKRSWRPLDNVHFFLCKSCLGSVAFRVPLGIGT
jgi:hypothetical protein